MKAISLWQPWATLIAIGAKRIETRSWPTSHRGPLAIHAAKRWTKEQAELCCTEPFASALRAAGIKDLRLDLPFGGIVATVRMVDCIQIPAACQVCWGENCFGPTTHAILPPPPPELSFGDYRAGRWAWLLDTVRKLESPVPYRASQGLFVVPPEALVPPGETEAHP